MIRLLPDLRTTTHGVGLKVRICLLCLASITSTPSPTSTLVYLAPLLSSACIFDSPFSSASLSRTSKSSRSSSVKSGSFPLNFRLGFIPQGSCLWYYVVDHGTLPHTSAVISSNSDMLPGLCAHVS